MDDDRIMCRLNALEDRLMLVTESRAVTETQSETMIALMRDLALQFDMLNDNVHSLGEILQRIFEAMPEKTWFVLQDDREFPYTTVNHQTARSNYRND